MAGSKTRYRIVIQRYLSFRAVFRRSGIPALTPLKQFAPFLHEIPALLGWVAMGI
jgi:hypothetical protein